MDTETTPMSNSLSQNAATIDEAFDMALEERAAALDITVDYYMEEFFV
tara:strand:- start:227 stop:370 length:144 start_codon:yes stop_codon:yes gene_type:complete